ncbi:hypothetical protein AB1J99_31580 [Bacillus bombysepticus]
MLKEKIQNSIGRNINITLTSINNLYNKKIKEISPFTANQIILLMALNCTKNMHINEINEQFGLMQHSMSDFLSPLLNNNLILNSEDYLSITENGKRYFSQVVAATRSSREYSIPGFTENEKEQFLQFLSRIQQNIGDL